MKIDKIKGLVFENPAIGEPYGTIREWKCKSNPEGFPVSSWTPFAGDDGGNIFAISKKGYIAFWDHETDKVIKLADSFEEFCNYCREPEEVPLEEGQVISSWVDPDFKPEF